MKYLNAAADDLSKLTRMGLPFEVVVQFEKDLSLQDDKYLFNCRFERKREIFLDVKTHGGFKINHYPIRA